MPATGGSHCRRSDNDRLHDENAPVYVPISRGSSGLRGRDPERVAEALASCVMDDAESEVTQPHRSIRHVGGRIRVCPAFVVLRRPGTSK